MQQPLIHATATQKSGFVAKEDNCDINKDYKHFFASIPTLYESMEMHKISICSKKEDFVLYNFVGFL
jgi:hypothetical protein